MRTTTPLRHSTLRRRKPLRRHRTDKRRSQRERDSDYMAAVRKLPCVLRVLAPPGAVATPCCGEVQADHAGMRPFGRKASDDTCIPLCRRHHTERSDHHGTFFALTRDELRAWRADAIEYTRLQVAHLLVREAA